MILMIDEELKRVSTIKEYLEDVGYSIILIGNVDDALTFIDMHKDEIEAIILDIMMPRGNMFTRQETEYGIITGYKFFMLIREKYGDEIPIIVYTAVERPDLLNHMNKQKNCVVLHKPNSVTLIIKKLQEFKVLPQKRE